MSVEYRGEFTDKLSTLWTIDVENDDYSDSVKELLMDGDPINFEFLSPSEQLLYPPIKGSMASFRVISDTHFKYAALYAASDFAYKVNIYHQNEGQLITGWNNSSSPLDYDTLTLSGTAITSAITDGSDYSYARGVGSFSVRKGESITISTNLTSNSGEKPFAYLYSNSIGLTAKSNIATFVEGDGSVTLVATEAHDDMMVAIGNTAAAANWSMTEVTVERSQYLFWTGWITPASYSEPYDSTPYTVEIACTDGLGLLKNVEFKDDGEYYNGRMTEAAILVEIFGKIDITEFKEYINIYEDNMDSDVDDSPLDQAYIDVDVFRDMNCYEVLEYLLIKWNAIIRQWMGDYCIYRPIDLSSSTIYGRHFTDATTKTAITRTLSQLLDRNTGETDLLSVNGGMMTITPQAKEIILNHDYRYKDSWIDNYKFEASSFKEAGTNFTLDWWSRDNYPKPRPAGEYFPDETEGVYLDGFNERPLIYQYDVFISQVFGTHALNANPLTLYNISFDYAHYNRYAINYPASVKIIIKGTTYYLKGRTGDDQWSWTTDQASGYIYLDVGSVAPGLSDWTTVSMQITGLPEAGPFTIKILARDNYESLPFIRNIKFTEDSVKLTIKKNKISRWETFLFGQIGAEYRAAERGRLITRIFDDKKTIVEKIYTADVNDNGEIYEINHILGDVNDSNIDNVLEQFAGSLGVDDSGDLVPTTYWSRRGRADRLPLLEINKQEYKQMYARPGVMLSIPIYDQADVPLFDLFNNIQDPLNQDDGDNRVFAVNMAQYSPKQRLWNVIANEIVYKDVPGTIMGVEVDYPDFLVEPPVIIAEVSTAAASIVCNAVNTIANGLEYDRMNVTINYTNSGGAGTATIQWQIKDSGSSVVDSDTLLTSFAAGTGNKAITGVTYPAAGNGYTLEAKISTDASYQVSNSFNVL